MRRITSGSTGASQKPSAGASDLASLRALPADAEITAKEAATLARVHQETMRGWMRDGIVRAFRRGGRWRMLKRDLVIEED